jgi:tetratricopeptide (TPR) repeat protein
MACFAFVSACWVLLLYRGVFSDGFVYDDLPQVVNNPALLSWRSVFGYFAHAVPFSSDYLTTGGSFYRPLFWISLAIDRRLWGLNAAAFHGTNLVLHFLNGLLIFVLTRKMHLSLLASGATALLWLGLPINSEAVIWISARHIELCACFVLLSAWFGDRYANSTRPLFLACYFLCVLSSAFSYEAGVLAIPLTLIYVYFRSGWSRNTFLFLTAAGLALCAVYLWLRHAATAQLPAGSLAMISSGAAFFKYFSWVLAPLQMSVERSTSAVPNHANLTAALGLAGVVLLAASALRFREHRPAMAFGLSWLLFSLLPFCGLVPNYQGMGERYLYLPSFGLLIALTALTSRLRNRTRMVMASLLALWGVWGALRLQARVLEWKNEFVLDEASLRATPRSPILLYNLALNKSQTGDIAAAAKYYEQAIASNPRYTSALLNLSTVLRQQRRYAEAIEACRRVIAIEPGNAAAWLDLGNIYVESGSPKSAQDAYQRAALLDSTNVEAVINLGAAYQRSGDLPRARQMYERAIAMKPSQPAAYCNLGALLFQEGDIEGSVRTLNRAIELDPSYPTAYFDLGVIYQAREMYTLSAEMYGKALSLNPNYEAARKNLEAVQRKE